MNINQNVWYKYASLEMYNGDFNILMQNLNFAPLMILSVYKGCWVLCQTVIAYRACIEHICPLHSTGKGSG